MAIGTTAAILGASALGAAGSIAGSKAQSNAAKNAANASQAATDQAIAEQRRQYDLSRSDMQPWLSTGQGALGQLAALYGIPQGGAQPMTQPQPQPMPQQGGTSFAQGNSFIPSALQQRFGIATEGFGPQSYNAAQPMMANAAPQTMQQAAPAAQTQQAPAGGQFASFFQSPDYQFRLNEGMRGLTARNAALGIQDSGAAQRAALTLAGNQASGEFNNYANRLAALAGVGQSAASNNASAGANFANSYSGALMNNAQNLGSSYQQQGAANAGMWGNLAGIGTGLFGQFSRGK